MPIKYKKKKVIIESAFICDVCEQEFSEITDGIKIEHTFNYYSKHDCEVVEAIICENCFYDLIKKNVKNAIFSNKLNQKS